MKRWWLGWWAADIRPVTWPPSDAWLGTWVSGEREAEPSWSMCAWVEAATESDAWALVRADWPELGRWEHVRFCKESEATPGDRFPRPKWATGAARDAAWGRVFPVDDRLLAPCTADLLRGWTGPVHGYVARGLPTPAVCVGLIDDQGRVALWTETGDAWARPEDLLLHSALAECRDRVARVLAGLVLLERAGLVAASTAPAWEWAPAVATARWTLCDSGAGRGWTPFEPKRVPALGELDPHDDTRLPDGSRFVDAWALKLVAESVWRNHE